MVQVLGRVQGSATPVLAVRDGSATRLEQTLTPVSNGWVNASFAFRCQGGRRKTCVVLRLAEGEGTFRVEDLHWTPLSRELLRQANLAVPPNLVWIE
jgi:hypothetical protein